MRWEKDSSRDKELNRIFGSLEQLKGSANDLIDFVQNIPEKAEIPALLQICGTEDFLYEPNQHFRKEVKNRKDLEIEHIYKEEPGKHNWEFWDKHIQTTLNWIDGFLQ